MLELMAKRGRRAGRGQGTGDPAAQDRDGLRVAHAAGELPEDLVGQTVAESSLAAQARSGGRLGAPRPAGVPPDAGSGCSWRSTA